MSNLTSIAYLVSSILFILSLRGLSHPTTARRGNFYGIVGMAIAIITTVSSPGVLSYKEIAIAFVIGGLIGSVIAVRIQMTALPQLVAAFHSLVGLGSCFCCGFCFL
jgi:NAD(P) transhydrogenase subunit beta